jgi:dynein heavy chain
VFPRFYFVSDKALLEILSNGNNPEKVNEFVTDCFDGMKMMRFAEKGQRPWKIADGMYSKEMEFVPFKSDFVIGGAVENYMCDLERKMQDTLKEIAVHAKETTDEWEMDTNPREVWLDGYCAQLALLATQIIWTEATARAFDDLESGSEMAMKEHGEKIKGQINKLIFRVRQDLDEETRLKVITIITIDVHSRDVIKDFVDQKIQDAGSFAWARQLKFGLRKSEKKGSKEEFALCFANIADWQTQYNYEYVGNTGRLVITPLTDRCYITLTQALNLSMGGAPAGPAGTGKTETTKDLGRALGLQVVVFNCSEQMNYQSMGLIFMGLSQAGAWGCFDEFNRIQLEVLSVVSSQVKTCLDAVKKLKANPNNVMFQFEDENIPMKLTTGYFITMNPGYAGRTELPENLKALFTSCAMVVPDIVLICENMLMAEGFENARDLSKKFMTLYSLAKSLLSPQRHYDWGLRAVKSVLRQAGGLKRGSPDDPEYNILMRALRDFNLPKIVVQDQKIFLDLIIALFPKVVAEPATRPELLEACEKAALKLNLQPEKVFVQKCVDLADILDVRHCMFIIGGPGTGKTQIWRTLSEANTILGQEAVYEVIDPKAVSSNELFGCMNPKTKEWKDGVLSVIMRDMNKNQERFKAHHQHKWVILDGDVEPTWIESLNTVMDDNKVLTLVSQERIPLTKEMRLVLEVSNLKNATPATVSRG